MNAHLAAQRVQTVRYELSDVKVLEIAGNRLVSIAERLQSDPDCATAIKQLVKSREFVCQGVSVLLASARYAVEIDARRSANGEVSTHDLSTIGDAMRKSNVDVAADAQVQNNDGTNTQSTGSAAEHTYTLASGEALDYGVKAQRTLPGTVGCHDAVAIAPQCHRADHREGLAAMADLNSTR